jgi:hypothetical protein
MAARKIIGLIFSIIAILFSVLFIMQTDLSFDLNEYFNISFKSYFSLDYLRKITPLIINLILLYGGILLIYKPLKSNPVLALFGITVMEEALFNWFGVINTNYPRYIIAIFLCCAMLSVWIAYSNKINKKRLSFKEGASSLFLGTIINLSSYYL